MWGYYLRLGFASLRRNPVLTALMVLTLAVGVSASMTTLTILLGMSGDPIPHKSDRLLVPLIDNRPLEGAGNDPDPPQQLTWRDAEALWTAARADRQVPLFGMSPTVDPGRADLAPFFSDGIATGRDFFAMFEAPFLVGGSWTAEHDRDAAPVVVLGRDLAERNAGGGDEQGDHPVRPRVHRDRRDRPLAAAAALLPAGRRQSLHRQRAGVHADPHRDAARDGLRRQHQLQQPSGRTRFPGPAEVRVHHDPVLGRGRRRRGAARLRRLPRRLRAGTEGAGPAAARPEQPLARRARVDVQGVVENDTRTAAWLSFGFLLVCLVNTVGLLLAKFSSRPGEIGVRRALGAARREIIRQYLTEAAVIGLVGAVVGVLMTWGALAYIRGYNRRMELIAQLDLPMLLTAVAVAVGAAILAGLLPTWRACQVLPAMQLKSQ
jgi:putative ABC transport system permease protein